MDYCLDYCSLMPQRSLLDQCLEDCRRYYDDCGGDEYCVSRRMAKWSNNKMVVISLKLPVSLLLEVDRYAFEKNTTRSHVMRRAIQRYLETARKTTITRRLVIYPSLREIDRHGDDGNGRRHKRYH